MADRLSHEEREEIACGVAAGLSYRRIASMLGRATTTICREVTAGSNRDGTYRATSAQRRAGKRARRPKRRRFHDPVLAMKVNRLLEQRLSPQAVSLLCARDNVPVATETIYREIYRPKSLLHDQAAKWLCRPRPGRQRRKRLSRVYSEPLGRFRPISWRPDIDSPGNWEGDLLIGTQNRTACVVVTETGTGHTLTGALPHGQGAQHVLDVICDLFAQVPQWRRLTLTWDQGRELAKWSTIEKRTGLTIYFCDSGSPWQKGLVEGTCGLLRRWLPRNQPIPLNQEELDHATRWLNHMPRHKRGGYTTQELYDGVATTM